MIAKLQEGAPVEHNWRTINEIIEVLNRLEASCFLQSDLGQVHVVDGQLTIDLSGLIAKFRTANINLETG